MTPASDELPNTEDTVVGDDVWIGYEALAGVPIGDGAIVAARPVVTANVAPYTDVGGNPARPLLRRFPDEVVDALPEIRWWDWDPARIARHLEPIASADLEALRAAARAEPPAPSPR